MERNNHYYKRGIVAIEIMVVVVVLMLAVSIAVPLFLNREDINRNNITYKKIVVIKQAIVGDPLRIVENSRSSFGFVGDLGVLPSNLNELFIQGTYPGFSVSNNVWFGWRGPYIDNTAMSNGNYVALLDAWGNPIVYDTTGWPVGPVVIRSSGPDGVSGNNDDIYIPGNRDFEIYENEVRNYVSGTFKERVSKNPITSYDNKQLNIHYPDGDATLEERNIIITQGQYETQTPDFKIPVGNRYFETEDELYKKLATLNGLGNSIVDFYGEEETLFDHPFDNNDDGLLEFLGKNPGQWKFEEGEDGDLYLSGDGKEGEQVVAFGDLDWVNYRIEVEVSMEDSGKEDGFGIDYRVQDYYTSGPSDHEPKPHPGYRFKYYPGDTGDGGPDNSFLFTRFSADSPPVVDQLSSLTPLSHGFGRFRFLLSVETIGTDIQHTLVMQKRNEVTLEFEEVENHSFTETFVPGTSSGEGKAGFLVWGHQESIRLYWVKVYPI